MQLYNPLTSTESWVPVDPDLALELDVFLRFRITFNKVASLWTLRLFGSSDTCCIGLVVKEVATC